jgi:hypothetical protein
MGMHALLAAIDGAFDLYVRSLSLRLALNVYGAGAGHGAVSSKKVNEAGSACMNVMSLHQQRLLSEGHILCFHIGICNPDIQKLNPRTSPRNGEPPRGS